MKRIGLLVVSFAVLGMVLGCAGTRVVPETEPEYKPTHVTVGEIWVYNQEPSVNIQDLIRLITQFTEEAMYDMDVHYIPADEIADTPVSPGNYVILEMELSFQEGTRGVGGAGVTAQITYTLRRASDKKIYMTGSANAEDQLASKGMSLDTQMAVQYGAKAVVAEIKAGIAN